MFAELALQRAPSNSASTGSATGFGPGFTATGVPAEPFGSYSSTSGTTSASSSSASTAVHPLPRDVLDIVAGCALMDLPFVPMDPKRFVGATDAEKETNEFVDDKGEKFHLCVDR